MIKLEPEIQKNGFTYRQMCRTNEVALYSQHHPCTEPVAAYEVFRVRIQGGHESVLIGGSEVLYVEREMFPHDEMFGYGAWTYKVFKNVRD